MPGVLGLQQRYARLPGSPLTAAFSGRLHVAAPLPGAQPVDVGVTFDIVQAPAAFSLPVMQKRPWDPPFQVGGVQGRRGDGRAGTLGWGMRCHRRYTCPFSVPGALRVGAPCPHHFNLFVVELLRACTDLFALAVFDARPAACGSGGFPGWRSGPPSRAQRPVTSAPAPPPAPTHLAAPCPNSRAAAGQH